MLTNPTLDHMHMLGLPGIDAARRELADQPESRSMDEDEWLGLMLDHQIAVRADKRLTAPGRRLAAKRMNDMAVVRDMLDGTGLSFDPWQRHHIRFQREADHYAA
ncbi:hypothetical protein [Brucella sp. 22210]|uniref:hypothetical protein n=1 Tax=Brucella sp. 22210 TaxID=3453892 RepID=UPI003F830691